MDTHTHICIPTYWLSADTLCYFKQGKKSHENNSNKQHYIRYFLLASIDAMKNPGLLSSSYIWLPFLRSLHTKRFQTFILECTDSPFMVTHAFNPALMRQRLADIYEFMASQSIEWVTWEPVLHRAVLSREIATTTKKRKERKQRNT